MPDELTTLDYVKDYGNITVGSYDSYLTKRIAAVSAAVEQWCNRTFAVNSYSEIIDGPGAYEILVANNPVISVTDIILGIQSATPMTIPSGSIVIQANGLLSVQKQADYPKYFPKCSQDIQVDYSAGYASIPTDVQDAVSQIIINQFFLRGVDQSMKSERIGDYSYERAALAGLITGQAAAALSSYRQTIV